MLMRYTFACPAMVAPVPIVCMVKLMCLDHCLSGLDRPSSDFGISCSVVFLNFNLDLNCIPFDCRCLTLPALSCNVLHTFIG